MKLLHCTECKDIKALTQRYRFCSCKKSSARYEAEQIGNETVYNKVVYRGPVVILAMKNEDIETLPSMESNIVFQYFKQKETYRTMIEKSSPQIVAEMGHQYSNKSVRSE